MVYNGELPTSQGALYTAPTASLGATNSGQPKSITWVRVVNDSGATRTFNLYLNVNGTARSIIPVDTNLPDKFAYGDDIPPLTIAPGASLQGDADAAGVSWTINVE